MPNTGCGALFNGTTDGFNWACRCSGRSRGFGFITFDDAHDAKDAVDDYEKKKRDGAGTKIDGREVRVAYSLTKKAHNPTRKWLACPPAINSDRIAPPGRL